MYHFSLHAMKHLVTLRIDLWKDENIELKVNWYHVQLSLEETRFLRENNEKITTENFERLPHSSERTVRLLNIYQLHIIFRNLQ